jgi:hypothetical protein
MTSSTAIKHFPIKRPPSQLAGGRTSQPLKYVTFRVTVATSQNEPELVAESATSRSKVSPTLEAKVAQIFSAARYEIFEDGMESEFSRGLIDIVLRHGQAGVLEIAAVLKQPTTPSPVAAEALRWLGWIRDPSTHAIRQWVLCDSLTAHSLIVRDGAIVGLTYFNDPSTRSYIVSARASEASEALQIDLDQLLDQLDFPEKGYVLSPQENPKIQVGSGISQ